MTTSNVEARYEALTQQYENERHEIGEALMASWDSHWLRKVGFFLASTVWLSIGGQTLVPIGWLMAMLALVPEITGWSLARRIRVTSWRSVLLLGAALLGLFVVKARIGILGPTLFSAGIRISL